MQAESRTEPTREPSYLSQAWLVLMLSIVFGGGLAGVQVALAGRIAENKLQETLSQIPTLVPGAEAGEPAELGGRKVYKALAGGELVGWVVPGSGPGFADRIELLVGVDARGERITGLYVLDQKETPGLGDPIKELPFRQRFTGKSASEPLTVTKSTTASGQQITALTGATISAQSVCDIVNQTLSTVRPALPAGGEE